MNISSINSPSFQSRNIDIRKADDIARHVNKCFPMLKPTYAMQNWKILNTYGDDGLNKRTRFYRKFQGRVFAMRDEYLTEDSERPFYIDLMNEVNRSKTGNCYESAYITLGTLFANGIKKAIKVSPELEIVAIHKDTKQAVLKKTFPIDHTCVLTSMNNKDRFRTNDLIVVDGWLNKALTVSDAKKEYAKFISKKQMASNFFEVQELLKRKLGWAKKGDFMLPNEKFNISDYEFKYSIQFLCDQRFGDDEVEEFAAEVVSSFPRLKLNTFA